MFSKKEQLLTKTGPNGVGRYDFLSLLVQEFYKTSSQESKLQVLANLANFSYDPINYEFIRQLEIIDLFLNQLLQRNEQLLHFSLSGLCNLTPDPTNAEYIIRRNGVFLVSQHLLHHNVEISLNTLSTLIFLINADTVATITTPEIINKVLHYKASANSRLRNLGNIFLEDYCTREQISHATHASNLEIIDIPLPTQ